MKTASRLPQYSDDEVRVFHPFFETCLRGVIQELGLEEELEVVHHWTKPGFPGIIDFAICNRRSTKVLLPIEVKKTPIDLRAMGRQQARGYSESLGVHQGSDFYVATNLEFVELFKSAPDRVLTIAQLLELSSGYVGELSSASYAAFFENLRTALLEVMGIVHGNDGSQYASNISGLLHALETSTHDEKSWHQASFFYGYDFIRGALQDSATFGEDVKTWMSSVEQVSAPEKIQEVVARVDFDLLFEDLPDGRFSTDEIGQIAAGAFEAGKKHDFGDELTAIVNEIATRIKKIPGVVETSQALAKLLSIHAASVVGSRKLTGEIFEPGCGTGNLIVAARAVFESLDASQILAIERESLFREALALRLGLIFEDSLARGSRPRLDIRALESIERHECRKVQLVLMNPPFIGGVHSVQARELLAKRITSVTGSPSVLTGGQLGYECGYIELVLNLVPDGAIIATVFPKNSLTRSESAALRKFLIESFGLAQVVVYRDQKLFGNVQKSTVLLIGRKGIKSSKVKIFKYRQDLEAVDTDSQLAALFAEDFQTDEIGITENSSESLTHDIENGWKRFIESQLDVDEWLHDLKKTATFTQISNEFALVRGSFGNSGGSDFLFCPGVSCTDARTNLPEKWSEVPMDWIIPGIKNSKSPPQEVLPTNCDSALTAPREIALVGQIDRVVEAYLAHVPSGGESKTKGSQTKKLKTATDLKNILAASQITSGPAVLVPRAQRSTASIVLTQLPKLAVSTNFFIISCTNRASSVILASWLFSVFGQLQLESLGIDQEGMRKVEGQQIGQCLYPKGISLSEIEVLNLERMFLSSEPMEMVSVVAREIDRFWAEKLAPSGAVVLLERTVSLLQSVINDRLER